jgi:hypothetical protein
MKQNIQYTLFFSFFFLISGSLFGFGEKTLTLGSSAGWSVVEKRDGVVELNSVRPHPVLALSSARGDRRTQIEGNGDRARLDLALSFDEGRPDLFSDQTGHYGVTVSPAVSAAGMRWARAGIGAVHFSGNSSPDTLAAFRDSDPLVITPRGPAALLFQDRSFRDFSLEFWLYPMNMENGEQILTWSSTRRTARGDLIIQRVQCVAARNRLQWTFLDFFSAPDDSRRLTFTPRGAAPVIPQTWSHHLIRFDADTGLLEYLVDGNPEDIVYVTSTGREGGEVYTPVAGEGGRLVLGSRFVGLMDEFRLYGSFVDRPLIRKYSGRGGRIETRVLDLGEGSNRILRLDAFGGRTSNAGRVREPGPESPVGTSVLAGGAEAIFVTPSSEYTGAGQFKFDDDSAVRFFIRTGNSSYFRADQEWRPIEPGTELAENLTGEDLRGRYIQLAAEFYPSGSGETTPYIDELRIIYAPDEPPHPPTLVTAIARDGAVDLSWRNSPDRDVAGYLIYYGTFRGEFFGDEAVLGASPINVGKRNSIHIDGLRNGVLYYFVVAAYDRLTPPRVGEFSRDVSARPLRMIE